MEIKFPLSIFSLKLGPLFLFPFFSFFCQIAFWDFWYKKKKSKSKHWYKNSITCQTIRCIYFCSTLSLFVRDTLACVLSQIFGMAFMPLLCRNVGFLSYHRKVSLAVNFPISLFSFYRNTNLHFYKWARLPLLFFFFLFKEFWNIRINHAVQSSAFESPLLLFTFCQQFSNDLYVCHNMLC